MEVLESEREWVASQQLTAQVRRAQLESAAQLYKALGGGIMAEESARLRANEQKVSANGVQK
jgi:multidrug efflux system outer membrane protein